MKTHAVPAKGGMEGLYSRLHSQQNPQGAYACTVETEKMVTTGLKSKPVSIFEPVLTQLSASLGLIQDNISWIYHMSHCVFHLCLG